MCCCFSSRYLGSTIHTVSAGTYARLGSAELTRQLEERLISSGQIPYVIPVGGSNAVGAWGYLELVQELIDQIREYNINNFDHIIFACGSGGTATGIALGIRLTGIKTKVHAVGVCDSPDYFYEHIDQVAAELGVDFEKYGNSREWCTVYPGQGIGYARSTEDELSYMLSVSKTSGIIVDPVYSGKALYYFSKEINQSSFNPDDRILFLHTGGILGMYDKVSQLETCLDPQNVQKMRVNV